MKILALDVGTGTQDILLFDSTKSVENCIKMVMPAPTVIAGQRIQEVTRAQKPLALTGVNMGGGPVTEATIHHKRAGFPVFATPEAAATFDDDMDVVKEMGVTLASLDEINSLPDAGRVELRDLDLEMVGAALIAFDVRPDWDVVAVAVFDHGFAPAGYSDRKFRFDHLRKQIGNRQLAIADFAYLRHEIPDYMTRMRAVVECAGDSEVLLMDTAEAALVGALEDDHVAAQSCKVITNLGNGHTLAFHLHDTTIQSLFEHHTGLFDQSKLESYLRRLVKGALDDQEVWLDHGHGAITLEKGDCDAFLSVTGPQRHLLNNSPLHPYFAAPYGDMMLTGAFGLVRAWAEKDEASGEEVAHALRSQEISALETHSHP